MLHPALVILIWLTGLCAVSFVGPVPGAIALAILIVASASAAPTRLRATLHRARFFVLATGLSAACFTPGEIVPSIPWATWEGLFFAATQVLGLLLFLASACLVSHSLGLERFVQGLITILSPLRCLGVVPERIALRLSLTLEYVESGQRQSLTLSGIMRSDGPHSASALSPTVMTFAPLPWRPMERVGMVFGIGLILVLGSAHFSLWP